MSGSVDFFDRQFRDQIRTGDFALNPFEREVVALVRGRVLDFGCGLGNLALACARAGHSVTAVDASPTAIEHLRGVAAGERLPLDAIAADATAFELDGPFDTVASIGLLMLFDRDTAHALLARTQALVAPRGLCAINVLATGTTFEAVFGDGDRWLFDPAELRAAFDGWQILVDRRDDVDAPGGTRKVFATLIAERG